MNRADIANSIMRRKAGLFRRFTHWLMRLMLRMGLLPASARADSDTMGEWKRLMAERDDPKPGLVLPDPNAPHAELIRRVRLYAQNGAKALAPLLDEPLPAVADTDDGNPLVDDDGDAQVDWDAVRHRLVMMHGVAHDAGDWEAKALIALFLGAAQDGLLAVTDIETARAAYNSPWTVIDGEVYEYESEKRRRVMQ